MIAAWIAFSTLVFAGRSIDVYKEPYAYPDPLPIDTSLYSTHWKSEISISYTLPLTPTINPALLSSSSGIFISLSLKNYLRAGMNTFSICLSIL